MLQKPKKFQVTTSSTVVLFIGLILMTPPVSAGSPEAARYYEDALVRFEKNDLDAAKVQLKNALQQDPDMLAARILLGRIHLKAGNGAAAEKELVQANQLGGDRSLTVVPLAEAYLMQFKYQDVVDRIRPENFNAEIRNKLLALRGHAYIELEELGKAELVFAELERLAPAMATPYTGRALLSLRRGRQQDALSLVQRALQLEHDNIAALNIRASVYHTLGRMQEALQDYDRILKLQPGHLDARIARAGIWIDQGKYQLANKDLAALREKAKLEPRAAYLHSVVLKKLGNNKAAHKALEAAAAVIDRIKPEFLNRHSQLLMLAGMTFHGLDQFEKARTHLNAYIQKHPDEVGVRKLYGALLLERNENIDAISILRPAYENAPHDYRVLSLLGTAYMRQGRHSEASHLLQKAVELSAGSAEIRTEYAISQLGRGEQVPAIEELSNIFASDSRQSRAGVLLGMLHIRQGSYHKAVAVAEKLYQQQPDNLTVLNLLGSARVLAGSRMQAREAFERALSIDPEFFQARIALARLDVLDGQADKAVTGLKQLLKDSPNTQRIVLELARVEDRRNNRKEAVRLLEKVRSEDRKAIAPRLYLADIYIRDGKAQKAIEVAQEAELVAAENLSVLEISGRSYVAAGKPDIARAIYKRMNGIASFDAGWLYRIARLQLAANAQADAIYSLHKAVESKPEFMAAQVALVETQLQAGRYANAAERAAVLLKKFPQQAVTHRLMGDLALRKNKSSEAIKHYRAALAVEQNTFLTLRLYQALDLSGETGAAISLLEAWVKKQPQDMTAVEALAEAYLRDRRYEQARRYYEQLVDAMPKRHTLYNNLAYVYYKLKHDSALAYAQRAHQMAPDDAVVNDTLGWILVQQGKAEEGLPYLRNAHFRISANPEIRYHIAVALHQLGRKSEARVELEKALASGQAFEDIENAKLLLKKLGDK